MAQVVVVSNLRESVMADIGLDHASLQQLISDVVSVFVTPFGIGEREDLRGELAGWYMAVRLACCVPWILTWSL